VAGSQTPCLPTRHHRAKRVRQNAPTNGFGEGWSEIPDGSVGIWRQCSGKQNPVSVAQIVDAPSNVTDVLSNNIPIRRAIR